MDRYIYQGGTPLGWHYEIIKGADRWGLGGPFRFRWLATAVSVVHSLLICVGSLPVQNQHFSESLLQRPSKYRQAKDT